MKRVFSWWGLGAALLGGCAGAGRPLADEPIHGAATSATTSPSVSTSPSGMSTAPPVAASAPVAVTPPASASAPAGSAQGVTPQDNPPAEASASAATSEPPPLPKGTKVLHVGDSFAGALGIELNLRFKERGVNGLLRYKTASFIPTWAWGRELPLYMVEHNPDLVIITLGANEVAIKDPQSRAGTIKKLVGLLGGRPCVWVGVPLWATDTGLMPVIRENCAPCRYMDSNAMRFPDGRLLRDMPRVDDKIHPTMKARREWSELVVDWLARERVPDAARPWELRAEGGSAATPAGLLP